MGEISGEYLAALIDGEGSIMIIRDHRTSAYRVDVSVTMGRKSLQVLHAVHACVGGRLSPHRAATARHQATMTWCVSGRKAIAAICLAQPYLVGKVRQAELAIQFWTEFFAPVVGRRIVWTVAMRQRAEQYRQAMKGLNAKGPEGEVICHLPPKVRSRWNQGALWE